MHIELRNIDEIKPYEKNPRINDDAVEAVAKSIKEFGFRQPIVVAKDGVIVAGHTRWKAAKHLGLEKVPVHVAKELTPEQIKAFRIADNKTGEIAEWDYNLLPIELSELQDANFDLSLLGFDTSELDKLLNGDDVVTEGMTDPDEIPETPEVPVSKRGEIYHLGNHRLMCGDSTDCVDVQALVCGEKADLIFTDPPWHVNYGGAESHKYLSRTILNDNLNDDEWAKFCNDLTLLLAEISKPGTPCYVVMSAQEWGVIDPALRCAGFHWSSTIIWVKDVLVISRKDYHTQYEPLWYGWLDGAARLKQVEDRKQSDVWEIPRPRRSDLHPTTKPVELIVRAIKNSSRKDDIVVDLFGGSGSTLIAAEQTGRKAFLMELDEKYCDVIRKRWAEFVHGEGCDWEELTKPLAEVENE
jgi:site-specific DNA-methyltransferase (adenine-specific)